MHVTAGQRLPPSSHLHPQLHAVVQSAAAAAAAAAAASSTGSGSNVDDMFAIRPCEFGGAAANGSGSARFQLGRLSVMSQPASGTTADFDDAIMESMDTELFEADGIQQQHSCSHASIYTNNSQAFSSSAMAALAQDFARLPDRSRSVAASGGGAGRAAVPVGFGSGGPGIGAVGAALTEVLRGGGSTAGGGCGDNDPRAGLIRSSVVAVDTLALKPAGVSHDGVMTAAAGHIGQFSSDTAPRGTAPRGTAVGLEAARAVGPHGGEGLAPSIQGPPSWCSPFRTPGHIAGDGSGLGHAALGGPGGISHPLHHPQHSSGQYAQHSQPSGQRSQLGRSECHSAAAADTPSSFSTSQLHSVNNSNGSARYTSPLAGQKLDVRPGWPSGSETGTAGSTAVTSGSSGIGSSNTCPAAAASDSAVQPALARVLAGNAPMGPVPVPSASGTSPHPHSQAGLAGSIAAAAFRSVSSTTGYPSLAAPGPLASPYKHNSLPAVRGATGESVTAELRPPLSQSEPWTPGAGLQPSLASVTGAGAAAGASGGAGRGSAGGGAVFPSAHLHEALQGVCSGSAAYGDTAAVTASAAAADVDAVMAAVRALLRLDPPLDLPYTRQPPPPLPEFDVSMAAPASASQLDPATTQLASGIPAGDVGVYAPDLPPPAPLPPMPLPASVIDSLESSGVPSVDRYLRQLLLDQSAERHMFLCKRSLSTTACRAIASCLQLCPGVKSITLSYCGITCEGLAALTEGLRTCRDLLVLDLSCNAIGDAGASALASGLHQMSLLVSLSLAGNPDLGDPGVAALAAAARGCPTLRKIGLRGIGASPLSVRELTSLLAGNVKRTARRGSVVLLGGPGAVLCGGGGGGERPVTWDGTAGPSAGGGGANGDGVFIAQLCALLRTLVQPALAAEQAVADAVTELLTEAAAGLPDSAGRQPKAAGGGNTAPGAESESDLLSYLADGLTERGYDVAVTQALGGGSGGECLRNLRHTFLSVTCPLPPGAAASDPPSPAAAAVAAASLARTAGANSTKSRRGSVELSAHAPPPLPYHPGVIIVDPELRGQFEVAMPTPRYEALIAALPRVYVGAEERLPLVVEVLCDEMALALRTKGLVIPPWRESSAMISKWQPKQSKLLMSGATAAATAATANGTTACGAGNTAAGAAAATESPPDSYSRQSSNDSRTPRVSLAGGMALAPPVPVHWRHDEVAASSGINVSGRPGRFTAAVAVSVAAARTSGEAEPSLGPAPSLYSNSGAGSSRPGSFCSPSGQSFGFRRCSTQGMSPSVVTGLGAGMAMTIAAAAGGAVSFGGALWSVQAVSGARPLPNL